MGYDGGRKTLLNGDSGLCQPGEDYAIIIHGWQESCDTEWVSLLASSTQFTASLTPLTSLIFHPLNLKDLTAYRGGCIICMDYNKYSRMAYMQLYGNFDSIAEVLAGKLRQMERLGFSPDQAFLFGFSYGGRLAVEAAQRFGPKRINQIDSEEGEFCL